MRIEPFQFQQIAASQIADRFMEYYPSPVVAGRGQDAWNVPFFQALSALTGAGKTVILAEAVSQMAAVTETQPVVLWISRGKVVVQQSYANLAPGGKYNHLLDGASVKRLADYRADDVAGSKVPQIFFATVGTFNQEGGQDGNNLLIYKSDLDNAESSVWEALTKRLDDAGRRRPLFIIYDEAQNLSDAQTDRLSELQPDAIIVASATMALPRKMADQVDRLRKEDLTDEWLSTSVDSPAVVASGLVKSELYLEGDNTIMEVTVGNMLDEMKKAESDAQACGFTKPIKAIYVCKTNMIADDAMRSDPADRPFSQRQAPPILIWKYLVNERGIDPADIAVYANLKTSKSYPLPDDFNLFSGGDKDYDQFTSRDYKHIIFNLSLQEGWDDPHVYFAYVDKSMQSDVQITQVIGRVLRQPGAKHYPAPRLNTAHFYIRVDRNEAFAEVYEDVKKKLGKDFPTIKITTNENGKNPLTSYPPRRKAVVPRVAIVSVDAEEPVEQLLKNAIDYRNSADVNVAGVGRKQSTQHRIGSDDATGVSVQDFEQANRVSARWAFHREVAKLHVKALSVTSHASDGKFDAQIGIGSPAYAQIKELASNVVNTYIENIHLKQQKPNPYEVGSVMAHPSELVKFQNSVHEGYAKLNDFEERFARALDTTGAIWSRNPSQSGYSLPLVSIGQTANFFPDFLVWREGRVLCIDTKGAHILSGDLERKLLTVEANERAEAKLSVHLVSEGSWNAQKQQTGKDGCAVWGWKNDGSRRVQNYQSLDAAIAAMLGLS